MFPIVWYTFMIDVLGARWNLPYALRWCQAVEQYRPYWLEEVFLPGFSIELDETRIVRRARIFPAA